MYAGEAEKQLSSLAQMNQQLANEQYNKKMQAMQLYNALTVTGDKRRGSALKDATRSGIMGIGANVVDFLRGDNGNDRLNVTNSFTQGQDGSGTQAKAPTGKPLIEAVKQFGGFDASQGERLAELEKIYGGKTPDYYKQLEKIGLGVTGMELMDKGSDTPENIAYNDKVTRDKMKAIVNPMFKDQAKDYKVLQADQAVLDKDVAKQNKQIEAQNLKAQKEFELQERKDPIGGFINYAKEKGLEIPTEFVGSKDDQRKQNYDLHNSQIEYFLSKGRRDLARKAESEWIQNEMNIDKSWGDDGKRNYSSLWNTNGPAGDKMIDIGMSAKWSSDGSFMPASNVSVPKRVWDKGKTAVIKYLNEQGSSQGDVSKIADANFTKPVSGSSEITPATVEFDKGEENKLWANAKETPTGAKVISRNGAVLIKMPDGTTEKATNAQAIKFKEMGILE